MLHDMAIVIFINIFVKQVIKMLKINNVLFFNFEFEIIFNNSQWIFIKHESSSMLLYPYITFTHKVTWAHLSSKSHVSLEKDKKIEILVEKNGELHRGVNIIVYIVGVVKKIKYLMNFDAPKTNKKKWIIRFSLFLRVISLPRRS